MKNLLRIEIPSNRIFGLDLLRAIAILAVVTGHGQQFLPPPFKYVFHYFIPDGVTIFFVLSGFLIGNILLKMLQHDPLEKRQLFQFWKRRWMRTLPNYYLALVLLCIVHLLLDPSFSMALAWKHFIFSQNLLTNQDSSFFQESWSLSVEEWFYLLIPALLFLLFWFFKPDKQKAIMLFCIFLILAIIVFRYIRFGMLEIDSIDAWDYYFRKSVAVRMDSLLAGILGGCIRFYHPGLWSRYKWIALTAGILLFAAAKLSTLYFVPVTSLYSCVFSTLTIALATLLVLPVLSNYQLKKGVFYKSITVISLISYSMYVLHLSLIREWIVKKINWENLALPSPLHWLTPYLLYWGLVILLSVLLYKYFELPVLKRRERIKP